MARREQATPETDPQAEPEASEAPSVKEPSEVDEKLADDQEAMQPDSS
jgi:hypothetical protein